MELYTMEQWKADRTFKAEPGQEIAADVYEQMLNCMPPKTLPQEKARQALQDYKIPVHAGFLMGEPHSASPEGERGPTPPPPRAPRGRTTKTKSVTKKIRAKGGRGPPGVPGAIHLPPSAQIFA
jgi:hypothetical protein